MLFGKGMREWWGQPLEDELLLLLEEERWGTGGADLRRNRPPRHWHRSQDHGYFA